jgi:hypothetical protein
MRTSTAYFAGVGTVAAAVAVGLGGGLLISNIVSPHAPKIEMSKLELRMSEKPIPATNASSEPAPNAAPAQAKPAEAPGVNNATASAPPAPATPPQAAAPVTQAAASEQAKTPEAAFAKANDGDMKSRNVDAKTRDADVKSRDGDVKSRDADVRREARRAAEERRRAERRQHWVERREQWAERRRPRQDQELRDVEQWVREETEPTQAFASERVRPEMPRIRLFGDD